MYVSCLSGGAVPHKSHTTAEIQEEVALTNMGTMATSEKRHSNVNNDKLHFPRANLQTITALGRLRPHVVIIMPSIQDVFSVLTFSLWRVCECVFR